MFYKLQLPIDKKYDQVRAKFLMHSVSKLIVLFTKYNILIIK